jgi:hypothetical protein
MTKAFDLALFVPAPTNPGDGVVVDVLGPPFTTKFAPLVTGSGPGIVVGGSMPKATSQNQILISGPGPNYAWALGTNPAAAATVPPATAFRQLLMADASLQWQDTTIGVVMALGNAVTTTVGGVFSTSAKLTFTPTSTPTVCVDGGDPAFSVIDNFSFDAGTF